jgi:hypothetical protein
MVGVCSLRAEESDGVPCTIDPNELVVWTHGPETVTVFATDATVGLRILQRAHAAGLPVFDLRSWTRPTRHGPLLHRVTGAAGGC